MSDKKSKRAELMRWALLLVIATAAGAFIYQKMHPLDVGQSMPPHQLISYDGQEWTLERFRGKPIVVNFWAPWCTPCMRELPEINAFAKAHVDDVVVVGAVVNASAESVFNTIKTHQIVYPIAKASPEMIRTWKAESLPTTVIIRPDGSVLWSGVGEIDSEFLVEKLNL